MVDTSTQTSWWPALPLEDWRPTKETLHRYCQLVGKVRMALAPFANHWWHVTLRIGTRGLTTGPMPVGDGRTAQITLDFVDHVVDVSDSVGNARRFDLTHPLACADFHDRLFAALEALDIRVDIDPRPYDLAGEALSADREHDTYDAQAVARFWRALASSALVLEEFAGWFNGKQSPVQLFWHSFDLAHARYSGRRAPVRSGAGTVEGEAYSHEVIAFGFWAGDDKVPFPAYYSYTSPAPVGLTDQPLPEGASWDGSSGTAVLPYDAVRSSADPRATLLAFFQACYLAGGRAAGWDLAHLATRVAPDEGTSVP
jgi:hypothetical protein